MRKNLSKVLSLLLSLCMVFAMAAIPAMAEGEAAITGIGAIIAPPKGVLAAIPAGLVDAEGTAVASPTLTVGSGAEGVYKNAQNLIIDGDAVSGGSFALTATSGETSATQHVAVSDILYYEDFEDVTVPETGDVYTSSSYLNKLDGTKATTRIDTKTTQKVLHSETFGKNYAESTGLIIDLASILGETKVFTIEAMVRNPVRYYPIRLTTSTGLFEFQFHSSRANYAYYAAQGGATAYTYFNANDTFVSGTSTSADTNPFVKTVFHIDLNSGVIKWWDGGTLEHTTTNVDAINALKGDTAVRVSLGWEIDEICIYSGTPYTATGSISGPSTITAPESGKYTKQPTYKLLNASGNAVENATISLAKNNACMKLMNNSLVVSGANVDTTPNYLVGTDANGDFIAKKEVKVSDIKYFEDFEENVATADLTSLQTINGTASEKTIASAENSIITEGDNHYANGLSLNVDDFASGERYLTIKYKCKLNTAVTGGVFGYVRAYDDANMTIRKTDRGLVNMKATGDTSPYTATNATSNVTTVYLSSTALLSTEWRDVVMVFDFETGAISTSILNKPLETKYFTNFQNKTGLRSISFSHYVDDVSVTTGKDFYIAQPELRLNIPGTGEETTAVTATYNDGTPAAITSITESYDGIETNGANVIVSSDAAVNAYTLTLSDGFVSSDVTVQSDKDYVLLNDEVVVENTALATGSNTVKAVYGASDLASGRQVIIAHYGNDENRSMKNVAIGTQSGNVINANLTGTIESGDRIRVFTWIMDTLVPIKLVTID